MLMGTKMAPDLNIGTHKLDIYGKITKVFLVDVWSWTRHPLE